VQIKREFACGCPECYAVFNNEIKALMEGAGIKGAYRGDYPLRLEQAHSVLTDRVDIRTKLEESIAKEEYEKAAFYRDRLKALDASTVASIDDGRTDDGRTQ
jgi:protein arginine kinase activator